MWFATAQVISCYDGSTWKNYSKADGLPNSGYFKIWADKEGNIWAITKNLKDGISCYEAQGRQWHHFDAPPAALEAPDNKEPIVVTSAALLEDRDTVYIGIGTDNGFFIYCHEIKSATEDTEVTERANKSLCVLCALCGKNFHSSPGEATGIMRNCYEISHEEKKGF